MGDSTNDVPTAMSTSALESKLKDLREKSNKHSQILTAKLASSQSGQNLLHIGTSLSSLPPDLHSLLSQLHPVVSSAEGTEKQYLQRFQRLVQWGNEIRTEERRVANARDCAELYEDLLAAERVVKRDASQRQAHPGLTWTTASSEIDGPSKPDFSSGTSARREIRGCLLTVGNANGRFVWVYGTFAPLSRFIFLRHAGSYVILGKVRPGNFVFSARIEGEYRYLGKAHGEQGRFNSRLVQFDIAISTNAIRGRHRTCTIPNETVTANSPFRVRYNPVTDNPDGTNPHELARSTKSTGRLCVRGGDSIELSY